MTLTQASTARKLATIAFSGVVALTLMLPTQLAFADYSVGDQSYSGDENNSGNGAEGGTWSYTAEGQQMTLVDYVGDSISATSQDLNVQLEGNNVINGSISVQGGDLTINGDENVDGADKPNLEIAGKTVSGTLEKVTVGGIRATGFVANDPEKGEPIFAEGKGSVTVSDTNLKFSADNSSIIATLNLTVKDSRITKNDILPISAGRIDGPDSEMVLQGSEIEASNVAVLGTLTIDNTNLTVTPDTYTQKQIDEGTYEQENGCKWIETAVMATKGINLKGEQNGEVVLFKDEEGDTWYYLTTGEDYKVELKASATPAYWGKTKGMPATGDTTMPLAVALGIAAMAAAAMGVYSFRNRKAEDDSVK